jgi:4-alpha-glucanotransferase
MHVTSLPGRFGIGDLGPGAYRFVEFLASAGQRYWQVLPLGQTGYGNSPYGCFSAFAGNIWLISPEGLAEDGFLEEADLDEFAADASAIDKVDFGRVIDQKRVILARAFDRFRSTDDTQIAETFHRFCESNRHWLDDYALFQALRQANGYSGWRAWEPGVAQRLPDSLDAARAANDELAFAEKFAQFAFFTQWAKLKSVANEKGVAIIGDIPIYLPHDSADVWCNQQLFKLDENGDPTFVSGVPPDHFSSTGQLWGSPVYDWDALRESGFQWWIERMRASLELFDIVRIDHFVGLRHAWEVPAGEETAVNGTWVDVPGNELFEAVRTALGELRVIAEDLGEVTLHVAELRDTFEIPGMRILQFAFGSDSYNLHLPHNYRRAAVVYTGTHDNETTVGWYSQRKRKPRGRPRDPAYEHCRRYLGSDGREIHWDFIREAYASVADIAVIPMQDVLGLDNSARMNTPSSTGENWAWRCRAESFSDNIAARLLETARFYAR